MSDIQELMEEIKKYSNIDKEKFDNIKFALRKKITKTKKNDNNSIRQTEEVEKSTRRIKTKEEIYDEMKDKLRFAWKGNLLIL